MDGVLSGLKIVSLTQNYIAAPYCTKFLVGLGANVVKIKKTGASHPPQRLGPFLEDEPYLEKSSLFLYPNDNKALRKS